MANYPEGFNTTADFEKVRGKLKANRGQNGFDTRKWFKGHILRYNYSCTDCHTSIRLISHIHYIGRINIGGRDYVETFFGGLVLWDDLFRLNYNGTVRQVFLLPDAKAG